MTDKDKPSSENSEVTGTETDQIPQGDDSAVPEDATPVREGMTAPTADTLPADERDEVLSGGEGTDTLAGPFGDDTPADSDAYPGDRLAPTGEGERPSPFADSSEAVVLNRPDGDESETSTLADDRATPVDGPAAAPPGSGVPPVPPTAGEAPRMLRGPGFFALLLGGLVAGLIGYGIAYYTDLPGRDGPDDALVALQQDVAALDERIGQDAGQGTELTDRLSRLEEQITAMTPAEGEAPEAFAAQADVASLTDRLDNVERTLSGRLDDLDQRLSDLAQQVQTLEDEGLAAVSEANAEAIAGYREQLQALQSDLDAQRAAIDEARTQAEQMRTSAEAQQRAMIAEAAVARIRAAVEAGGAFPGPLAELDDASDVSIPQDLFAVADSGVPSLPQLQATFPEAARDALAAAIASEPADGSLGSRFGDFLRAQTGARSLAERAGDDPDAVLSRAEARLAEGDLPAALNELAALNEAGQQAMAEWIAAARARVAALDAVTSLSDTLAAR